MIVYIDEELNWAYPFFNKTIPITYALYQDIFQIREIKDHFSKSQALFLDQILTITEENGDKITISVK